MGLSIELSSEGGSLSCHHNTHSFFCQRFWGFLFPCWYPGLHGLSCSRLFLLVYPHANVGPPATALPCVLSTLAAHLCPSYLSPPLIPVWINVSSLTPWLLGCHTVWFSGSSGCFLSSNLLLFFFWLCEEATCIYAFILARSNLYYAFYHINTQC